MNNTISSQISSNKSKTYIIILLFIIFISGFFFLIGQFFQDPSMYFIFGLAIALISSMGSYYYSDRIVLFTSGAKPASKNQFAELYSILEQLTQKDSLPMPKIYFIQDPAPNAFATGRNPQHAVVCVTTGLLEHLDRSELEGVLAHELSHVKNYDILVSSIVGVLVGVVGFVSDWVMRSMWWGNRSGDDERDNTNPLMLIFMVLVVVITPIVAVLIQLAVSRKREYLADASGALLTHHPDGLARALEKISSDTHILRTASTSTAHLFISNPFKLTTKTSWLASLFSTHPPIEDRIRILRSM